MTSESTADKPFRIEKRQVYEAYKAVKANHGAAGVDGETLEMFEKDLVRNLYKIWNRMSSGAYFPPPVRAVSIPKKAGGERVLGVPTVSDRIAQMVVKQMIEPDLDSVFLPDSYGYRSGKSALDAVGVTRQRCWKYDWVGIRHQRTVRQSSTRSIAESGQEARYMQVGPALHRKMAGSLDGEEW
jgi:RNA-directed DNA polymerase